ncbi:MAG: anhydro-N-acetylmuramic acid kinase [Cyclobacteriaceae bacterium]
MTKEIKSRYKVIGIMAGSSMDGLDLAEVSFFKGSSWTFKVENCKTYSYDEKISGLLSGASDDSIELQYLTDRLFGEWIGECVQDFTSEKQDLIAVHGHTLIHQPENGISWQLGRGDIIADFTGMKVVSDFRSQDVESGGQGAPLVPVGDFELFKAYDACLNLGGIANVSIKGRKLAWDICPCNQVLNYYSIQLNKPFDENGRIASSGTVNSDWLNALRSDSFFTKAPPKSLPNEFIHTSVLNQVEPTEGLRTYCEFIAERIISDASEHLPPGSKILSTGGGALNTFLMELLNQNHKSLDFVVPERQLIDFKEAIVFAFLGLLKLRNEINVLASVTGAKRDSSSGVIHYPK